jgi:GAF domain-containing protein
MSQPFDYAAFVEIARYDGLKACLGALNARVEHRYTAVYRLDGATFYCKCLFDRLGEMDESFIDAVPLNDSFCQFVIREGLFEVTDSARDKRLDGHRYQGVVMAYHAVPVPASDGQLFGTLCHLDFEPRPLPPGETETLKRAAYLLSEYLEKSPTALPRASLA